MNQESRQQSTTISQAYGLNESDIPDINIIEALTDAYKDIFSVQILNPSRKYQLSIDQPISILSTAYNSSGQFIANACSDGALRIIQQNKDFNIVTLFDPKLKPGPATCVKWRPNQVAEHFKNSLLATYTNGTVLYWHATSKQNIFRVDEKDNTINVCEFSHDGDKFVTGGNDCKMRFYDLAKLSHGPIIFQEGSAPTHQNRIFGIKFQAKDPNILYSGGWDKTVLQWDIRQQKSTGYIYGPNVFGDSIDSKEYNLLIGQYKEEKQLEIYDTRMLTKLGTLDWIEYGKNVQGLKVEQQQSKIYSCKFDQKSNLIYGASVGTLYSEIRVFDGSYKCIDSQLSQSGIQSIDHSPKKNTLCYGTQDGNVGIMNIVN